MLQSIEQLLMENLEALGSDYSHENTVLNVADNEDIIFMDNTTSVQNLLIKIHNIISFV